MASVPFSSDVIDNFCNMFSDVFEEHYIADISIRNAVARYMLKDPAFTSITTDKFLFQRENLGEEHIFSTMDTLQSKKFTCEFAVNLTSSQKALLSKNNPDCNIVLKEAPVQPHALAYAQRKIDTMRCQNAMNYRGSMVLDIGGNYATHAAAGYTKIHSCTLRDDVEEHHRQTQRDVNLEYMDIDPGSLCRSGVGECDVMASEGFSIHTLPRINPDDISYVFYRHGLEFLTGVHHYDATMDYHESGYMYGVEMHWKKRENDVEFFFEGDSSYSYTHRYDWLKRYSSTTYFADPNYSFIVYYAVDKLENGLLYWSMMRQSKETLGTQIMPIQYRYAGETSKVVLMVPEFVQSKGFSVNDPRAYACSKVLVPRDMFDHVYKTSMANATSRPDTPLSLDDVRNSVMTYNYVRRINGSNLTTDEKLNSLVVNKVALGIYLVVVLKTAQLKVTTTEYTKLYKRIQRRWGDENFGMLLTKCFTSISLLPFMMLASKLSDAVDVVSVQMRNYITSSDVLAAVVEQVPYYTLQPAIVIESDAIVDFETATYPGVDADISNTEENYEKFIELFKDDFTDTQSQQLRETIRQRREQTKVEIQEVSDEVAKFQDLDIPETPTREDWEKGHEYLRDNVKPQPLDMLEVDFDVIAEEIPMQLYESAMYNLDVALHTYKAAVSLCKNTFGDSKPRQIMVESTNNTTESAVKYFLVSDNKISDPDHINYMVFLDPITHKLVECDKAGTILGDVYSDYLFVYESFKVFLGYKLHKKYLQAAKSLNTIRTYELTLVDGIAGCGKTHEIKTNVTHDDLIVCAVRDTSEDTRDQILKDDPNFPKHRIRTIDSCVLNQVPISKIVYVDEGLMALPGALHYIAQMSKCTAMKVYGDSKQIGPIDFGSKLGLLRYPRTVLWTSVEYRDVTVRCPADITFAMKSIYGNRDIKTCSNIRRSVNLIHETDVEHQFYTIAELNVMTITFTRADRAKILKSADFKDIKVVGRDFKNVGLVSTVHEAQGASTPYTSVVRTTPFNASVFDSQPHRLVAMTRHTHSLKWISVMPPGADKFSELLLHAKNATDEELDSVMIDTPEWLQIKLNNVKPRGSYL